MPNVSIFLMSVRIDLIALIALSIKCLLPRLFKKLFLHREAIVHLTLSVVLVFDLLMLPMDYIRSLFERLSDIDGVVSATDVDLGVCLYVGL